MSHVNVSASLAVMDKAAVTMYAMTNLYMIPTNIIHNICYTQ